MASNRVLLSFTVKPIIWAWLISLNEILCKNTEYYCHKNGFGLWLFDISYAKVCFQMGHVWEHLAILEYNFLLLLSFYIAVLCKCVNCRLLKTCWIDLDNKAKYICSSFKKFQDI